MSKLPVLWDVQLFSLVDVKGCFAKNAASSCHILTLTLAVICATES